MPYTLNTGHALYGNLVELIGVQGGQLVSHVTARTFTKHADATYGTGTYGEHFSSLAAGYTAKGASFTPSLLINTHTTPSYTVVAVLNSTGAVQGATSSNLLARTAGGDTIRSPGKDSSGNVVGHRITGATIGTSARMITFCRIGETAGKVYNNTTLDANLTGLIPEYNSPDARADYLCGWDGQNSITASLVWLAVFNKELSQAEITDLYNSLGASNALALVETSGSTDGTASGAFPVVTLTAPGATATGTSSGATNGASSGALPVVSTATPSATATGTTAGSGTVSIPPITDFGTRTVLKNVPNITADFYNISTKALVASVTGLTSHASTGAVSVVSTSLVAGTTYRTVVEFTYSGHTYRGVWNLVAS